MKINHDKLHSHLSKSCYRCYLMCGDEPLIIDETRTWLVERYRTNTTEHLKFYADDVPWQQLMNLCQQGSLLATHRIIDIRLETSQLGAELGKLLATCIEKLPITHLLILSCPRIAAKHQNANWIKAFDSQGLIIQIWPLNRSQLLAWIEKHAQKVSLTLTTAAKQLIADYCQNNLPAAAQTLKKLSLMPTAKTLDTIDIQSVLTDSSHYTVFSWTEACLAGNQPLQAKILQQLYATGTEPAIILWAIGRETRLLWALKTQLMVQGNLKQILKNQRLTISKQTLYEQTLLTLDPAFWGQICLIITMIDQKLKGAITGNSWHALRQLGSAIALRDLGMIND